MIVIFRRILKQIKRVMMIETEDGLVLEISLYLNQNSNYKCLRINLSKNSKWNLVSSFNSGHKSYPGKFEFFNNLA